MGANDRIMISKKKLTLLGPQHNNRVNVMGKVNIEVIKDIRVVYYDSDIMFAGTEGDCLDFLEGCKQMYPHINGWKVTTIEEYGSNMWQLGFDSGYGSGYDDADPDLS